MILTGPPSLRKKKVSPFFETIISSTNVPAIIVRHVTNVLIKQVVWPEVPAVDVSGARRLLSNIQQRHPALLQKAADELIAQEHELKEAIEELIISFATVRICHSSIRASLNLPFLFT
jgi:U3 small nucleolar RNA-associated protein 10